MTTAKRPPTTQRPTLTKKPTRASRQAADDQLDEGVTIVVDGTRYTVRQGDLSALDSMALRRECGYSFVGLMRALYVDPDIDLIAAIVWLSRRIDGEVALPYAAVASELGYDSEIDVVEPEEGDGPDPEA